MYSEKRYTELVNAVKTMQTDVIIKCSDGDFGVIGAIISSRCQALGNMLASSMREGTNRVIAFPTHKCEVIRVFMNYLQYSEFSVPDEAMLFELYALADQYGVDSLIAMTLDCIRANAGRCSHAIAIYRLCRDSAYDALRDMEFAALKTIAKALWRTEALFECSACNAVSELYCVDCKDNSRLFGVSRIKCGRHTLDLENLACADTRLRNGGSASCPGMLTRVRNGVDLSSMPDSEIVELLRKIYG